jgi:NAD(P)-dependent dehydrogenase (short-subunit alcohol dehydrogenase family)
MQNNLFDLTGKVAIITGGAGLLGQQHAQAIADAGGMAVYVDVVECKAQDNIYFYKADVTKCPPIRAVLDFTLAAFGRVDALINNAAINSQEGETFAFETQSSTRWKKELGVGLTGAFLCSQIIGGYMAANGGGVIVNIGSDFANIAPDPRCYTPKVKPASYSVVKHGLLGLTKYLAAYWGDKGVRCNMLSPGGVENGQGAEFIGKIAERVPMGRMAQAQEYRGAIQFLCSDASSYMTGHNLIMDGGRSIW